MKFLSKISARYPKAVLAGFAMLFALAALPALNVESKLLPGGFEKLGSQSDLVSHEMQTSFGQSTQAIFALVSDAHLDPETTIENVRRVLISNGAVEVKVVAESGSDRLLQAAFDKSGSALQNIVPKLQSSLNSLGEPHIDLAGQPVLDYELNKAAVNDAIRAEFIAAPVLLILLISIYKRFRPILATLATAVCTLTFAKAIGFLLAESLSITVLFSNIVSMIGLAISIDYVLFLITRYKKARAVGSAHLAAIETAYSTAGRTVIYSAAAVALGFVSLFATNLSPLHSIAIGGMVVIGSALLVTNVMLPALISLMMRKEPIEVIPTLAKPQHLAGAKPRLVAIAGLVLLVLSLAPIGGLRMQSPVASSDVLPSENPAVQAVNKISSLFPGLNMYPINVLIPCSANCTEASLESIETKLKGLENLKSATAPIPVNDGCQKTSPNAAEKCKESKKVLVQVTSSYGPNDYRTRQLVNDIRQLLPLSAVGGAVATGIDFDSEIQNVIPLTALIVITLGFLTFTAAFKSVFLGLATLIVNLLVVGASLGLTNLFLNGSTGGALNSVTPVVLFAVIFGLTMDYLVYSVHFVQEHWQDPSRRTDPALIPLGDASKTIVGAALLMLVVFLAFLSAELQIVRELGIGLAIGVVLDSLIARSVILPYILDAYRIVSKRTKFMRKYV